MSFFIPSALAAPAAAAGEPNPLITVAMFGGLFVFMYFMIIRPQRKKQKDHRELMGSIGKGDEVVTNSGIIGKINKIEGDYLLLEVSDKVELRFQRNAIQLRHSRPVFDQRFGESV